MYIISGKTKELPAITTPEVGTMRKQAHGNVGADGKRKFIEGISTTKRFLCFKKENLNLIKELVPGTSVTLEFADGDKITVTKVDSDQIVPEREV